MSGRKLSRGTAPLDCSSINLQRTPSNAGFVDKALRKYAIDVPHRFANESCSSVESEFRYMRKFFMGKLYPQVNHMSIPVG